MLDTGAKVRNAMKKKINYTGEDIKLGKTVADFLPSPSELAKQEEIAR